MIWLRRLGVALCVGLTLVFAAACPAQVAAPLARDQFRLSAWRPRDGAPPDVWALGQSSDGFLWLGTGAGLFRFDGVTFRPFQPTGGTQLQANDITALKIQSNGDVWIGYYHGGASLIHDGGVVNFTAKDGFPPGWVSTFAELHGGDTWVATSAGLGRFNNGRWHIVGPEVGFTGSQAGWIVVDREGTLWVTDGERLVFLRDGDRQFSQTPVRVARHAYLAIDHAGVIWLSDHMHGTRALPGLDAGHPDSVSEPRPIRGRRLDARRLAFDGAGRLWGTDDQEGGVFRIDDIARYADGRTLEGANITDAVKEKEGLTSDVAVPLFEDREGNMWVGTNFGLNSFQRSNISLLLGLPMRPGIIYSLAANRAGLMMAANEQNLYAIDGGHLQLEATLPARMYDLVGDPDGALWFHSNTQLFRFADRRTQAFSPPAGSPEFTPSAVVPDGGGGLWVGLQERGIEHLSNGKWTRLSLPSEYRDGTSTALERSAGGTLWAGFASGALLGISDSGTTKAYAPNSLRVGSVTAIDASYGELLVGGELGLASIRDGAVRTLVRLGATRINGISGIASDDRVVWMNTNQGVFRISRSELTHAFEDPAHLPEMKLFDYRDGLPGIALQGKARPSIALDRRGWVWLATNKGVAWIDPTHVRINAAPPFVSILGLSTENGIQHLADEISLAPNTRSLRIGYTAASLSVPERVQFKYRLDGLDRQWQEAEQRREAFYTNLPPGHYRFLVMAANEDGLWSMEPAALSFAVTPAFYQTRWFYFICGAFLLLLAAFAYTLRIRSVARRLRLQLHERHRERERIARELHDTLLQSIQFLILKLSLAKDRLPPDHEVRCSMAAALDQADEVVGEARERISGLRVDESSSVDMVGKLRQLAEVLSDDGAPRCSVHVSGLARRLNPRSVDELMFVAREAMGNALRHAQAKDINVYVRFEWTGLRVEVIDDGVGMENAALTGHAKPGHWGIRGMTERAGRIGGHIVIRSAPGIGTRVIIHVPRVRAYWRRSEKIPDCGNTTR